MRVLCSSVGGEVRRLLGGGGEERLDGLEASGERLWRWLWVVVVGGGCYGASIGLWRAPAQAGWVAVKMPLLILLTLAVNGVFNGMLAAVLRTGLGFRQTLVAIGQSFTVFALVVGRWGRWRRFLRYTAGRGRAWGRPGVPCAPADPHCGHRGGRHLCEPAAARAVGTRVRTVGGAPGRDRLAGGQPVRRRPAFLHPAAVFREPGAAGAVSSPQSF